MTPELPVSSSPSPQLPTPSVPIATASAAQTEPAEPPGHTHDQPRPSPEGPGIEHFKPGDSLLLKRVELTSLHTGWGVALDSNNDDHIVHTHDGGLTWEDHTPPEPATPEGQSATAFFLDDEHAWAVYSYTTGETPPGIAPRSWSTSDGGETWQAGGSADFDVEAYQIGYPVHLSFIDQNTGWLVLNHGAAAGTSPNSIFQTLDSGQTWNLVKPPFEDQDEGFDICCLTGLAFGDAQNGLATKDPGPMATTYQVWTHDGGYSWLYQEPTPADQDLFVMGGCTTRSPLALPAAQAGNAPVFMMAVDCFQPVTPGGAAPAYLYITADLGAAWDYHSLPDPVYDPVTRPVAFRQDYLDFISPMAGWLVTETTFNIPGSEEQETTSLIYQTSDGGESWILTGELPGRYQFSFLDLTRGWAVSQSDEQPSFHATSDGGRTWQLIHPQLED